MPRIDVEIIFKQNKQISFCLSANFEFSVD